MDNATLSKLVRDGIINSRFSSVYSREAHVHAQIGNQVLFLEHRSSHQKINAEFDCHSRPPLIRRHVHLDLL